MNVINSFFPTEENKQYLQTIYSQGKDPSNWRSLNERYVSEFVELNQAAIKTNRIPLSQIETIIRIIRQLERTETPEEISQILQFNNSQFKEYFNDVGLAFEKNPEDEPQLSTSVIAQRTQTTDPADVLRARKILQGFIEQDKMEKL